MDDQALLRYSRQIMLPEFGAEGQQALGKAAALIIGLGGLGSASAAYLNAAGVGKLILADADAVDLSNLQRQLLFASDEIGQAKVAAGQARLAAQNRLTDIVTVNERLDAHTLPRWIEQATIIIDGSDNFATRQAVNRVSRDRNVPLVSGAVIGFEGEIAVYNLHASSPCYACQYGSDDRDDNETCAEQGVLSPLPGIVGAMQALETIKITTGVGQPLDGRVLRFDGMSGRWREARLARDPACAVCS